MLNEGARQPCSGSDATEMAGRGALSQSEVLELVDVGVQTVQR